MPDERDDLRLTRKTSPIYFTRQIERPSTREMLVALNATQVQLLTETHSNGLAAWRLIVPPYFELPALDPATGGGQSWLVIAGDLAYQAEVLPTRSCLFVSPEEAPLAAKAGPNGVEMLCLQYASRERQG